LRTRWTRAALADLEAIGDFVARDNPSAADRIVMHIVDAVEILRDHPHLGRTGRIEGTRELVIAETPYIVAYRVAGGDVQILAVIHGARTLAGQTRLVLV
jgi:addiction module RelE/StbE family toxin